MNKDYDFQKKMEYHQKEWFYLQNIERSINSLQKETEIIIQILKYNEVPLETYIAHLKRESQKRKYKEEEQFSSSSQPIFNYNKMEEKEDNSFLNLP